MFLRCCLLSLYLCPRLDLGLFILYQCDLFFIFSLIYIVINHIIFNHLFFVHFLEYLLLFLYGNVDEKTNNFKAAKVQHRVLLSFCLIFCQFQSDFKKACIYWLFTSAEKIIYINHQWRYANEIGKKMLSIKLSAVRSWFTSTDLRFEDRHHFVLCYFVIWYFVLWYCILVRKWRSRVRIIFLEVIR